MNTNYDVIVGGAGPVGLFLACELATAGVSVLVLERDNEKNPFMMKKPLGTRGMNSLSAEAFYRRGMLEEVFDPQFDRPSDFSSLASVKFAGHFAGIFLDARKFDYSRWKYKLTGPSLYPGRTDLDRIDRVLSKRANDLGIDILRGYAVTGHSQHDTYISVQSGVRTFTAKYLVGCDGGRSTIRKDGGFEFIGSDAQFTGYTVICDLDDPAKLQPGWQKTQRGMYITLETGQVIVMDFDGAKFDRSKEVTREHFQDVLRYVSISDVTVSKLHFASTFTDRALLATTYRKGRVFLAGDSAHVHSPLGGQGMNAGLGDAMNLGWKLAATIKGIAPESLLDSYEVERRPIGEWVTEWTRAQVNILQPGLFGEASYKIMRELIQQGDGTNYFADRFWGFSQRYELGNEHPLVGVSAPDFEFIDGTRLGQKMHSGKGLLVDFTHDSALSDLATEYATSIDYIDVQVDDNLGITALLIRPDGIVCWLAEANVDADAARKSLSQWAVGREIAKLDSDYVTSEGLFTSIRE